jgi:hypothetical protein
MTTHPAARCGLVVFLALTALSIWSCLGGDHDTLAPTGPAPVRVLFLTPVPSDSMPVLLLDGQTLWIPDSVGALSPRWDIPSGQHELTAHWGPNRADYSRPLDFYPNMARLLVVAGSDDAPLAYLIQDLVRTSTTSPLLRLLNACADSVAVDLKDDHGAPYFLNVLPNQITYHRSISSELYQFMIYRHDSVSNDLSTCSIFALNNIAYTFVLSGTGKFTRDSREIRIVILADSTTH